MPPNHTDEESQRKKSELELIIVSPRIDEEKSSPQQKFEHKEFTPHLGLVIPESFDRLDKRLEKKPEDETLIQIYQKLSPAAVSEKISEELWTNGSKITTERFNSFLTLSIQLYNNNKINQDKLIDIFMNSLGELAESGSIQILQELMSFILQFQKSDQEYILKAYPLALKVAAKNGHTDFIKELTSYFCKIVPDDRSFFEQAKTKAIMSAKSLYDTSKNQEEILKTLESLKYEVPVLEISPSGEVDSSSIYVY